MTITKESLHFLRYSIKIISISRHGGGMFPGDLDEHRVRTRRPVLVVVHVLYLNDYPKEKEQHST